MYMRAAKIVYRTACELCLIGVFSHHYNNLNSENFLIYTLIKPDLKQRSYQMKRMTVRVQIV